MAHRTVYECDRCRGEASVERSEAPPGWWLLKVFPVPAPLDLGTQLAEAMRPARHLCSTCSVELLEWLGSPDLPGATATAEPAGPRPVR